ncbi:MAG: alpha/beta fold hydrolase [Deltaproteobacteria bacterium]|nr:alpha/beta fold hydrolase [Candidatus Zymogenaceae bacterium]
MKKTALIILAIIVLIFLGLGIHWAVWEMKPPVPGKDLVDYGTFITVNGMQIHTQHEGTGTPVILIHGYTGNLYTWRFNISDLATEGLSVWSMDLPGFGYSDKPKEFGYTLADYADFLAAFMDAEGITKATLVGNSMGGSVAMMTYLRHPDRVQKLVLIDSAGYPKEEGGFFIFNLMRYPVIGDLLMSFNYRWVIKQSMLSGIYYDNRFVTDDVIDSYYKVYKTENGKKAPLWVGRRFDWDNDLNADTIKTIAVPALIVWGRQDTLIPVAHAYYFGRDIKDSTVVVIPEAGHLPHEEQADTVNALIADFARQK